jgi:hypothetical protein
MHRWHVLATVVALVNTAGLIIPLSIKEVEQAKRRINL